jgi:hypothetical protein
MQRNAELNYLLKAIIVLVLLGIIVTFVYDKVTLSRQSSHGVETHATQK